MLITSFSSLALACGTCLLTYDSSPPPLLLSLRRRSLRRGPVRGRRLQGAPDLPELHHAPQAGRIPGQPGLRNPPSIPPPPATPCHPLPPPILTRLAALSSLPVSPSPRRARKTSPAARPPLGRPSGDSRPFASRSKRTRRSSPGGTSSTHVTASSSLRPETTSSTSSSLRTSTRNGWPRAGRRS